MARPALGHDAMMLTRTVGGYVLAALAAASAGGCGSHRQDPDDTPKVVAPAKLGAPSDAAPARLRERATHAPAPATDATIDLSDPGALQNALDGEGRVIFATGATCYVEVPTRGTDVLPAPTSKHELAQRPRSGPEPHPVACPADYDDAAWDSCSTPPLRYLRRTRSGCTCDGGMTGNGPPPSGVPCPALARGR